MGLLQAAYRTYERQAELAGIPIEGQEPLTPLSHAILNAHIEITLTTDGAFLEASAVPKAEAKTIVPVTEESAGRTTREAAHPLSDQLQYLSAFGGSKYDAYVQQLQAWAQSPYAHPKVQAVLRYVRNGGILTDLQHAGVLTLDADGKPEKGRIEGIEFEKCLVRWRILPPPPNGSSACWEDPTLFQAYASFYQSQLAQGEQALCVLAGMQDVPVVSHPKGIVAANYGAKLISANDSSGFTYRGRFTEASQAGVVGYTASQKAHSALRWLTANHGVLMGGRTFLCWNPGGKEVPSFDLLGLPSERQNNFVSYQKQLLQTLGGYRQTLTSEDGVVVAALDAATTGRLSVTYYNELNAHAFLDRLQNWYLTCCWDTRYYGVQSPALRRIVECACGTQRNEFFDVDGKVLREQYQRLLRCLVDGQRLPVDFVQTLSAKASRPLSYTAKNRETLLSIACALIRKYRNESMRQSRQQKEEWTLGLDENNHDRSYLFGRLLAIAEHVERITYDAQEGREPNAIRMQALFSQRPNYAWRILEERLEPYYNHLKPGLRQYYRKMTQEITDWLRADDPSLNKKLEDVYLLGYYHQRAALTRKKEENGINPDPNQTTEGI